MRVCISLTMTLFQWGITEKKDDCRIGIEIWSTEMAVVLKLILFVKAGFLTVCQLQTRQTARLTELILYLYY
jgi:hypothetical protein